MATIYAPILRYPTSGKSIDLTKKQIFKCEVDGWLATDYQLFIYNADNNTQLYTSNLIHLSSPKYEGELVNHEVPPNTISSVRNLKYKFTIKNGSESVTSREVAFYNYEPPQLTFTIPNTIDKQSFDFRGIYSHPQNLMPLSYEMILFDGNMKELQNIKKRSPLIKENIDGFLSGCTYKFKGIVTDIKGNVTESEIYSFNVSYSKPSAYLQPSVENIEELAGIKIKGSGVRQNLGQFQGTINYVSDFITSGNNAIRIQDNSSVFWENVDIPTDSYSLFTLQMPNDFSGVFMKRNDGQFIVGYELGKFYIQQGDIKLFSRPYYFFNRLILFCITGKEIRFKALTPTLLTMLLDRQLTDLNNILLEDLI